MLRDVEKDQAHVEEAKIVCKDLIDGARLAVTIAIDPKGELHCAWLAGDAHDKMVLLGAIKFAEQAMLSTTMAVQVVK